VTTVDLSLPAAAALMAATGAGAAAQAVTGFGFSLVAAPVLVLVVGPHASVRLLNLLAIGVNGLMLAREWRATRLGQATRLLVPAVVVTPLAAWAVHRTDPPVLSAVVGAVLVGTALVLLSGLRAEGLAGRRGALGAGAVSAAMNTASGVGGPAVALYALNAGWPPEMARPTLQVYFLGLNLLSLVALGPARLPPLAGAGLAAAVVGGFAAGAVLSRRLRGEAVARAVLVLSLAGGAAALVHGLAQL